MLIESASFSSFSSPSPSSSSCFKKSLTMAMNSTSTTNSQKWYQQPWLHSFLLFFLLFTLPSPSSASSSPTDQVSYADHCSSVVPESTPTVLDYTAFNFRHQNGYYNGGNRILNQNSSYDSPTFSNSLWFDARKVYKTNAEGVFKIVGTLTLQGQTLYYRVRNMTYPHSNNSRSVPWISRRGLLRFSLQGFWFESSAKLCMVGSAYAYSKEGERLDLAAVLKLNFIKNSSIFTSLVTGTLESLYSAQDSKYFDPISMLMFHQTNYNYTLGLEEFDNGCSGGTDVPQNSSLTVQPWRSLCSMLSKPVNLFKLVYTSDCNSTEKCNPFRRDADFLPGFFSFTSIQCSDKNQRLRFLIEFSKHDSAAYDRPFNPNTTLVGEGSWDSKKNWLCAVACRILNATYSLANAHVGDCSFRLSWRFPAIWSLRERSRIMGNIWTNKTVNDLGYFKGIVFRSFDGSMPWLPGLQYEYKEIDRVTKSCPNIKAPKNQGGRYPSGDSYDMRLDMSVKNSRGRIAWGNSVPLSVGNHFYNQHVYVIPLSSSPFASPLVGEGTSRNSEVIANEKYSSPLNISYKMSLALAHNVQLGDGFSLFNTSFSSNNRVEIFAEGIYNPETGGLCMVGCRDLGLSIQISTNDSMDCEILVNIQFPPLNAKKEHLIRGRIGSTRNKTDPLYFEQLELSSSAYYAVEVRQSIWRMDFETIMVLISKTLVCVLVGLQLFHVKKHPHVLPSISLVMLIILTLGHMIPLLLNYEALFLGPRNRQNVLLGSGGWLVVNEVIVRVFTMIAFLMQLRLLQLSWSARLGSGDYEALWGAEKKTLFVSFPSYITGGLISLFVHWATLSSSFIGRQPYSLLGDLRSYAGFISDGFLVPQILLNIFGNLRGNALSHSFYFGITFVRSLPHAYDLYRAQNFVQRFNWSYIYANPGADFYSTAWDVIIPSGCLAFAAIIFLQQRFGGRCILPRRLRQLALYEKVPVVSGE